MRRLTLKPDATAHSRQLRNEAPYAERKLWRALRTAFPDAHFRRQVPLGPYFADFASHALKLVIEVDGESHAERQTYDSARTRFLIDQGYRVMRFLNADVVHNLDGIFGAIERAISSTPTPVMRGMTSPPHKGEGVSGVSQ